MHFNFWLCWVFVTAHELSLVVVRGGYSLAAVHKGLPLRWLLLLRGIGLECLLHTGSVVVAPRFSSTSSVVVAANLLAPWHVGSFWTRDQICVLCIGKQICNHWAIREAPKIAFISERLICKARQTFVYQTFFFLLICLWFVLLPFEAPDPLLPAP